MVTPHNRHSSAALNPKSMRHRRNTIQQYLETKEKQKSLTLLDRINQYKEKVVQAQHTIAPPKLNEIDCDAFDYFNQ